MSRIAITIPATKLDLEVEHDELAKQVEVCHCGARWIFEFDPGRHGGGEMVVKLEIYSVACAIADNFDLIGEPRKAFLLELTAKLRARLLG